ncbi:MAG: helix-turn-helix transcriptional regulator [Bryobacteraceae bacterium]|jgi:predicted XRE-type DNA-binding protein
MKRAIEYEKGSGNVFADLGFADPEEALAKAELARHINRIISERNLNQHDAGEILGVDQPRVSALNKGRLSLFSLEKLMQFAARLGNEVEITIRPSQHGGIKVRI